MEFTDLLAATTVDAYTMTGDRILATVAAVAVLATVIVGGLLLARPAGGGTRWTSVAALAVAVTGTVVGGLVVVTADGGPGTGNGIVGGYAALVLGPVAALLNGLVLARARRAA